MARCAADGDPALEQVLGDRGTATCKYRLLTDKNANSLDTYLEQLGISKEIIVNIRRIKNVNDLEPTSINKWTLVGAGYSQTDDCIISHLWSNYFSDCDKTALQLKKTVETTVDSRILCVSPRKI
ncbi:hypothetical protein CBL_09657 [Carabus blaptoides fortunei]